MNNMRKFWIIFSIFLLVILDFSLKYFFSGNFQEIFLNGKENLYNYFPVVWEFLGFQLHYNSGIAFGLPITGIFLQILTVIIIGILWFYFIKYELPKNKKFLDIAFVLIMAGAIAHALERIFMGKVVDFIAVKYFAIFNFADIYITIWGILFIFYSIFYERK